MTPSTEEVWAKRVDEWRRSGLSAKDFVRGRGFAVSTLKGYATAIGRKRAAARATLIQVRREPVRAEVVVELSGAVVRVPTGASAETLVAFFSALRGEGAR